MSFVENEMNKHKHAMYPVLEQITKLKFLTFDAIGVIRVFAFKPNQTELELEWDKTFDLCKSCGETKYRCDCHRLPANIEYDDYDSDSDKEPWYDTWYADQKQSYEDHQDDYDDYYYDNEEDSK